MRMTRHDAMKALLAHAGNEIIVAVYSMAFELTAQRPNNPLNYTSVGAMGIASSHGLGLALGKPNHKIIVCDGDGSLLMNLGSLVTVANAAPANFYHFLCENRTYDVNGGHSIPARDRVNFVNLAAAAGYRSTREFSDATTFQRSVRAILSEPGPVFTSLKIEPRDQATEAPSAADYPPLYTAEGRAAFKTAINRN
ncbi:MAG: thiamine pyrophosphate-dependent enzyme [Xanthobacteraceae bacterium]